MIVGVGFDLVSLERFDAFRRRRGERGLRRLFGDEELSYCLGLARPLPSLAGRFAAKEAYFKAIGTGYGIGGDWRDVRVLRAENGRPQLRLSGRAERIARGRGVARLHLSISHTDDYAGAYVVLES